MSDVEKPKRRKKVIRLAIVMEVDIYELDDEAAEFYLVDNHCVENHFAAIGKRIEAEPGVCNCCRYSTVELLPDGTEAYDPDKRG